MFRRILLPSIVIILGWGFWISPDFKVIAAGVAIFLFGMLSLENGFKSFTGGLLEGILQRSTDRLWKSIGFGVVSTSLMQSSSLVSVITISFLSAGLIGLEQGIGIIFGANLGTTTGAWLIAAFGFKIKISAYAMPMLVFGMLLIFQKPKSLKGIGYILAGMGFLLLGIQYMKDGFDAFKSTLDLTRYSLPGFGGLLLYSLFGILATVIMQSSHATLVLTITALASGQISYDNALALAIGANIGTTVTAIIGSFSANEEGKRLALAHLVFNLITGAVAIAFIHPLLRMVDIISHWLGIAADDFLLKLAVFHSLFNLIGILLMLPWIGRLVAWLQKLIPARQPSRQQPRYLLESSIGFPDTATEAVRKETLHLWDNTLDIIAHGLRLPRKELLDSSLTLEELVSRHPVDDLFDFDRYYEIKIKSLYSAIIAYISRASFGWEMEQSGEIHWLRRASQAMVDAIKAVKHLQKNLLRYSRSPNLHIRRQYQQLRIQVAKLLRELENLRHAGPEDMPGVLIDHLKMETRQFYITMNRNIDEMIRQQQITPEMATSLMNDLTYVHTIYQRLVEVGETLFVRQNPALSDAEKSLQLDELELREAQTNSTDTGR
jgi:phosphate:Na+ symporter